MNVMVSIKYEIEDEDDNAIIEMEFFDGEVLLTLPDSGFMALCGNFFKLDKMSNVLKEMQKAIKEETK
jgi:hypothetical protein